MARPILTLIYQAISGTNLCQQFKVVTHCRPSLIELELRQFIGLAAIFYLRSLGRSSLGQLVTLTLSGLTLATYQGLGVGPDDSVPEPEVALQLFPLERQLGDGRHQELVDHGAGDEEPEPGTVMILPARSRPLHLTDSTTF